MDEEAQELAGDWEAREVYTLADLRRWPLATRGTRGAAALAVLGDPVAHSVSPVMHDAALAACGWPMAYLRIHIRPGELAEALRLVVQQDFVGVNLTIPHKQAAMSILSGRVDAHAEILGAVNTLCVKGAGELHGINTDGPGFVRAVGAEFGLDLRRVRVMIIGAGGGAGRAIAAQCMIQHCPEIVLINRTYEKAAALADELTFRGSDPDTGMPGPSRIWARAWESLESRETFEGVDLVVNASALGLRDDDFSPVASGMFSPRVRVFDTVYRASGLDTPLLTAAKAAGAQTAGGRVLLLHQGALSFEYWFRTPAPFEAMRKALDRR